MDEKIIHTPIKGNFIYPDLTERHRRFGADPVHGKVLREDGDWRDYLPPEEDQNIRGVESSACYIEASQHAIATLEEEQFDEKDNNYSSRFNALLSDGSPQGGNPIIGADSIRHDGLIPDAMMPFSDTITSWEDFHSFKGAIEKDCRFMGKDYLSKKKLAFDVVVERDEPIELKYHKLKEVIKRCPPTVSVSAWYQDANGVYIKPKGVFDNHLVELIYIDEQNRPYIRDTYAPYLKVLEPYFNFDFSMRWSVEKKVPTPIEVKKNLLQKLLDALKKLLGLDLELIQQLPKPVPPVVPKPPEPPKILNREELKNICLESVGKDLSTLADDSLACAEAVSRILKQIYPDFPILISTLALKEHFRTDKRFKGTLETKAWQVILSPTGFGKNPDMPKGHVGILGENGLIYSNKSATGTFEQNYTLDEWIDRYRVKGRYPIFLYDIV